MNIDNKGKLVCKYTNKFGENFNTKFMSGNKLLQSHLKSAFKQSSAEVLLAGKMVRQ